MQPLDLKLLLQSETDQVEWKVSARNSDDVLQPACAFANNLSGSGRPGLVLYGVNKTGEVVGVDSRGQELDQLQQSIRNRLSSTAIYPTPSFDICTF